MGYLAALILGLVFAVAGVAKLLRQAETATTFAALGLPAPSVLARAVPALELGLAALLAAVPPVGALVALVALVAFTTVLVRSLRAGARVSCGCFGTAAARPVSFVEVVRNGLLAVLAVAALLAPRPVLPGIADVVLVTGAVLLGVIVLALCDTRRRVGAVWANRLPGGPA